MALTRRWLCSSMRHHMTEMYLDPANIDLRASGRHQNHTDEDIIRLWGHHYRYGPFGDRFLVSVIDGEELRGDWATHEAAIQHVKGGLCEGTPLGDDVQRFGSDEETNRFIFRANYVFGSHP